jgi:hypothetical protein
VNKGFDSNLVMAKSKQTKSKLQERRNERPWLVRFVLAHKRLFGSIVIGLLVLLLLPKDGLPVPRGFFAWDVGVTCFLVAVYWMVSHSDAALIRRQSAMQDEGRNLVLIGAIGAVIISVAVILVWLSGEMSAGKAPTHDLALVFLTIPLSWVFIHTISCCITRMNTTPSIAAPAAACAFPATSSRTIGTSSISRWASAWRRRSPTSR